MFGGTVNAETFRHSKEYFFYISLGIPFYMFGQAANPVIRADGSPKFAMISTLAGAVINIILDPIFIFIFKWGMMGAAVATVFGQVVTAILAVWYFMHTKIVRLSTSTFRLKSDIVRHSLTLGICSFLSQISLVASMAAINNMIRQYGAMDAGSKSRVSELFTKLLVGEAIVGAIALLIVELLPRQLIAIFGAANESVYYTDFAIKAFRIYLCMIVFACVNKATFIFLQAMGKAAASTALSMIREIVFGVGFALLLPIYFGLDGVLYSMPVSDILTAIVSAVIIVLTYRELRHSAS
ncbi:MAG: multidrug transporter MatE [Ruminococcus sp.]|nr:multidrug transporter MatE [Ruminococcus sp.]